MGTSPGGKIRTAYLVILSGPDVARPVQGGNSPDTSSDTSSLPIIVRHERLTSLIVMRSGGIDREPAGAGAAMNGRSRGARETTEPQVGAAEAMRDFALALERRRSGT